MNNAWATQHIQEGSSLRSSLSSLGGRAGLASTVPLESTMACEVWEGHWPSGRRLWAPGMILSSGEDFRMSQLPWDSSFRWQLGGAASVHGGSFSVHRAGAGIWPTGQHLHPPTGEVTRFEALTQSFL